MAATYATIQDLKALTPNWNDENDSFAERKLKSASAMIRSAFKRKGLDFDQRIAEGLVEEDLLVDIVCRMVSSTATSAAAPFAGEFSQLSQSSNGYSGSVSFQPGASGLYFRKNDLSDLGLPSVIIMSFDLIGSKKDKG